MRIIGSHLANTVLNLPLDDVRPRQGVALQQIADAIGRRYNFAVSPRPNVPQLLNLPMAGVHVGSFQVPFAFQNGTATIGDTTIPISRLDVAGDLSVIVVHTVTTEEGDIILDDIVQMLESDFGFRDVRTLARRNYGSNVILQFEEGIEDYIKVIADIQRIIGPLMMRSIGIESEPKIERLVFAFDPALVPAAKAPFVSAFTIERRVGHPFSENRYFSSAPLRTADHIRALEEIGRLLQQAAE